MLGGHLVLGWTLQGLHSYPLNDLSAFSLSQPVTWLVGSPPWGYQKREAQSPPPVLERICFISPLNQWTPTNAISRAPRRLQGWPADCLWKDLFTDKGGKNVLNSLRAKLATEAFREMLYGPIFFYRNYTQKYLVVVVESKGWHVVSWFMYVPCVCATTWVTSWLSASFLTLVMAFPAIRDSYHRGWKPELLRFLFLHSLPAQWTQVCNSHT